MFGDNTGGDGETESCAAVFGGEVRKEDVVLVSGRDAMAGIRDNNFNRVQVDSGAGFDGDIFDRRGFERLGGIVN